MSNFSSTSTLNTSPDLTGRYALITGASRGIGAALAKAYAKAGAHVILLARTNGGLEEVDDAIQAEGGKATLIPLDLTKLDEVDKLGPVLAERFGKLDIFVANAGMLGTLGPMTHMKAKEWETVITTNIHANFRLLRTLDPLLNASDAGRVIFVSSGVTENPYRAYWGAYTVSKSALEAMAMTYAAEMEKTNMRVNIVDPGRIRTRMRAAAYPGEDPMTLPAPEEITDIFLGLSDPAMDIHAQRFLATEHMKKAA